MPDPTQTSTQTPANPSQTSGTLEPSLTTTDPKQTSEPKVEQKAGEALEIQDPGQSLLGGEASKEGEPAKPGEAAPTGPEFEPYDETKLELKLPEGAEVDKEVMGGVKAIAEKYKMSQGAVQDMINLAQTEIAKVSSRPLEAWNQLNTQWVNEVKADKEIGGPQGLRPEVQQMIGKVFDDPKLADPGIRQALNATGAGNNPAIIRTLARMAKAITEGGHVAGAPAAAASAAKSPAQKLYPDLPTS